MVCALSATRQVPLANRPLLWQERDFSPPMDYESDMDVTQRLHCPTSLTEERCGRHLEVQSYMALPSMLYLHNHFRQTPVTKYIAAVIIGKHNP